MAAPWPRPLAVMLALWAASYAAYRLYYAFGGQIGMVGRPAPAAHFRHDNLVGTIIILTAAALPLNGRLAVASAVGPGAGGDGWLGHRRRLLHARADA